MAATFLSPVFIWRSRTFGRQCTLERHILRKTSYSSVMEVKFLVARERTVSIAKESIIRKEAEEEEREEDVQTFRNRLPTVSNLKLSGIDRYYRKYTETEKRWNRMRHNKCGSERKYARKEIGYGRGKDSGRVAWSPSGLPRHKDECEEKERGCARGTKEPFSVS